MKKTLAVLLLIATTVSADIGVVVSKSGVVIGKEVYAGETSGVPSSLTSRQQADPTLTFVSFTLPDPAFDAAVVPVDQTRYRTDATNYLNNDFSGLPKFIRAVLLVILDEINVIRTQLALSPRTAAQMKTAIQTKLNSGAAD